MWKFEVYFVICNFCLTNICRTTFDRQSDTKGGFLRHIKINHYMWNYVFFLAYLNWKDKNDYTGIESFIYEK